MGNQQGRQGISAKDQVNALEDQARNRCSKPITDVSRGLLASLAKILKERSQETEHIDGITSSIFCKHVFPQNAGLGLRLFRYLQSRVEQNSESYISESAFIQEGDCFLSIISDKAQIEIYFKIYAGDTTYFQKNAFQALLKECYSVAVRCDPTKRTPCPLAHHAIAAVADALFHGKEEVPISYAVSWVSDNCPRIIQTLHRFVVHQLTTSHRTVPEESSDTDSDIVQLPTPVLDRNPWATNEKLQNEDEPDEGEGVSLPHSQLWLLSSVLPNLYLRPSGLRPSQLSNGLHSLDASGLIVRIVGDVLPSHWTLLYNSDHHGLGGNRFQHHVFGYRGPSVVFVRAESDQEFCIACTDEWKESHQFWGGEDCMAIQLSPLFRVLDKGQKLIYLNLGIRGYAQGIHVGIDPKKPVLTINAGFTLVTYRGIPYSLNAIEVWGCGITQLREAQLDVKKWEVTQAEKQRKVNRNAEGWNDNPDKYLLEMGGRSSYVT